MSGLWVQSDVLPTGAYGVSVTVGEDRAFTLDAERAHAYAATCVHRATEADHGVATLRALIAAGIDAEHAAALLTTELAAEMPTLDHAATAPIELLAGVARRRSTREWIAVVRMRVDGVPAGDLTTADLRGHGLAVLEAAAAVELDGALHRCLTRAVGLDGHRARGVVHSLKDHWPVREAPRSES